MEENSRAVNSIVDDPLYQSMQASGLDPTPPIVGDVGVSETPGSEQGAGTPPPYDVIQREYANALIKIKKTHEIMASYK